MCFPPIRFLKYWLRHSQLWHMGLVAPRHVESSWTRDRTGVPRTGRRIPIHCTTGEVPATVLSAHLLVLLLSSRWHHSGLGKGEEVGLGQGAGLQRVPCLCFQSCSVG